MRRFDMALRSVDSNSRPNSYIGPLASTSEGGRVANVNNLYKSQVRDAEMVMPYGISSRPSSGMKAQTILNGDSSSTVVGVYDKDRPKVGIGDTCLYSRGGCKVYLSDDGDITVSSGSNSIKMGKTGSIKINSSGSVELTCSSLVVNGRTMTIP